MKIKKFNENIEWLDQEIIKLRDLTGSIKSEVEPCRDFKKIEFERGCFSVSKSYHGSVSDYLENEFVIHMANKDKYYGLTNPDSIFQDPKLPSKYTHGYLTKQGRSPQDTFLGLIGIFDLKGNLVFFTVPCTNMVLFGDVFSIPDGRSLISVNLVTHHVQIIPYFYR